MINVKLTTAHKKPDYRLEQIYNKQSYSCSTWKLFFISFNASFSLNCWQVTYMVISPCCIAKNLYSICNTCLFRISKPDRRRRWICFLKKETNDKNANHIHAYMLKDIFSLKEATITVHNKYL